MVVSRDESIQFTIAGQSAVPGKICETLTLCKDVPSIGVTAQCLQCVPVCTLGLNAD